MTEQSLSYVEKLENLHVLLQTRHMLKTQLQTNGETYADLEEDLEKIEEEIRQYTGNQDLEQELPDTLFNPVFLTYPNEEG